LELGKELPSGKLEEKSNDKRNKDYKKRRREKNKMWKYASSMNESYDLQRKEECCDEEEVLSEEFNCCLREEKVEIITKDTKRKGYSEPRERRSELEDCECEAQIINHQSNIVMTRPAVETEVSNKNTYDRQRRYDGCTIYPVEGKICLPLETYLKILVEETHHVNMFRGNYMKSSDQDHCMEKLKRNEMGVEPIIKNYIEKYYSEP
jgi:hypothetical protein